LDLDDIQQGPEGVGFLGLANDVALNNVRFRTLPAIRSEPGDLRLSSLATLKIAFPKSDGRPQLLW
jgi:hypothetical protein